MDHQTDRLIALDFVRGIAVLGILAVNIASFSSAPSASYGPDWPTAATALDRAAFLATLVVFEGKMRALFSMLFGAGVVLFVDRAEAAGRDGERLQWRRLGWLALFGLLHFVFLWHGDILFLYAAVGFLALPLRHARPRTLVIAALLVFTAWQAWNTSEWLPSLAAERAVATGTATAAQEDSNATAQASIRADDREEMATLRAAYPRFVARKIRQQWYLPLAAVLFVGGETLPYMLLGMALLRSGFFAGAWRWRALCALALGGNVAGGAATLGFAQWAAEHGFPPVAMRFAIGYGLSFAHLAMALGYAAALVLLVPRVAETRAGRRIVAAGRAAFSNYLGTSAVMATLFCGWGLGLAGRFGAFGQAGFVLLGWVLMLAWSTPWLARFRYGPLEWAWRSLTYGQRARFRR